MGSRAVSLAGIEMSVPAVVDFPTPPLPEATSKTCLTPFIGFFLGSPRAIISAWRDLMSAPDFSWQTVAEVQKH